MNSEPVLKDCLRDHKTVDVTGLAMGVLVGVILVAMLVAVWWRPIDLSNIEVRPTHVRINVNQADADTLRVLPGIGLRLSKRIVSWRQQAGGFSNANELQDVPGIGPGILARIRPWIVVPGEEHH